MNPKNAFEDRLEMLGSALRERPALTDRVMREVRQSLADGSVAKPAQDLSFQKRRRRWPFVTTTVAAIIAAVVIALIAFPKPSVGWEDVKQAIVAQKWIRASVTYLGGQHTIWLAPKQQIWAYKDDDRIEFSDGLRKVTYDYKTGDKQITKRWLSDDDRQRILPVDFSRDDVRLSQWLFGEKIVEQHRREVSENGKTWIEFQLVFWRGEANRGTLRVDPQTRLPVSLVITAPNDVTKSVRWSFDYPTDGPRDVYAMGAPTAAKIDDRSPSSDETKVLDGMAASRSRIGDFRLTVSTSPGFGFYRVSRKGRQWRIDYLLPTQVTGQLAEPAEGTDFTDWFATRLAQCDQYPRYLCDGKTVYEQTWSQFGPNAKGSGWHPSRHLASGDLLSAAGHNGLPPYVNFVEHVFPDRFGTLGWKYEFEPRPADAPGCVICKLSARLATAEPLVGHEWYYVDPRKGYAVVRAELFSLPPDVPANFESTPLRSTVDMEGFRQAPAGFWYPTVIRQTDSTVDPNSRPDPKIKAAKMTRITRYHFDFQTPLPDSLFQVDAKRDPKKESGN